MNSKFAHWIVLLGSSMLVIGVCYLLIINLSFFITRKEATAKIVSVVKQSDFEIKLIYFNDNLKKDITTFVKLPSSYKRKVENFGEVVPVYYSGLFPHNVYIKNFKVPRKGIIVLEFVMLILMCIGVKSGFDGLRGK
ncbi:MAG: hypothetical protein JNK27_01265 [Chitinophagaceae bacterium]|nr:hypothetical protein [Chitinophagaceae bacterium]